MINRFFNLSYKGRALYILYIYKLSAPRSLLSPVVQLRWDRVFLSGCHIMNIYERAMWNLVPFQSEAQLVRREGIRKRGDLRNEGAQCVASCDALAHTHKS